MDIAFHKKQRKRTLQLIEFFEQLVKEKEEIKADDRSVFKTLLKHLKGYGVKHNKILI